MVIMSIQADRQIIYLREKDKPIALTLWSYRLTILYEMPSCGLKATLHILIVARTIGYYKIYHTCPPLSLHWCFLKSVYFCKYIIINH